MKNNNMLMGFDIGNVECLSILNWKRKRSGFIKDSCAIIRKACLTEDPDRYLILAEMASEEEFIRCHVTFVPY